MKPLSTADFGKVMKQVYPRVRPRRLGTRGNSRYCYAGMRKRIKLNRPVLPSVVDPLAVTELSTTLALRYSWYRWFPSIIVRHFFPIPG